MNTSMTVEVIRDAAEVFQRKSADLRRMADELSRTGDWSIAGEAISTCVDLTNIRIDLSARYQYGSMDEDTIAKCDQCPTANNNITCRLTGREGGQSECTG